LEFAAQISKLCSQLQNRVEWNGVEWNGMEWNRMEQNGTEWNRMEQNGTEWNGMEQNGTEWNGMEWISQQTKNGTLTKHKWVDRDMCQKIVCGHKRMSLKATMWKKEFELRF